MVSASLLAVALIVAAPVPTEKPKPNPLTPKEIADGWIMLFDGETAFGWTAVEMGDSKKPTTEVKNGVFTITGSSATLRFTSHFREFEVTGEYRTSRAKGAQFGIDIGNFSLTHELLTQEKEAWGKLTGVFTLRNCSLSTGGPPSTGPFLQKDSNSQIQFVFPDREGARVELRNLKLRPLGAKPLFNGKNLDGWKVTQTDPKRVATKFEVTKDGELGAKNGAGDLQTEKQFDDFVLQFECKTNGKALNSGVFFRCMPDAYQNGYEVQIQNAYLQNDRTKPLDYGTGAIYRRIAARKVVSNDNEWFTITVAARGAHIATWVNGYQTVDWIDDRKPNDNPRQGLRTAKGHLSIQGHDPTTDLLFRNIRIAELPK